MQSMEPTPTASPAPAQRIQERNEDGVERVMKRLRPATGAETKPRLERMASSLLPSSPTSKVDYLEARQMFPNASFLIARQAPLNKSGSSQPGGSKDSRKKRNSKKERRKYESVKSAKNQAEHPFRRLHSRSEALQLTKKLSSSALLISTKVAGGVVTFATKASIWAKMLRVNQLICSAILCVLLRLAFSKVASVNGSFSGESSNQENSGPVIQEDISPQLPYSYLLTFIFSTAVIPLSFSTFIKFGSCWDTFSSWCGKCCCRQKEQYKERSSSVDESDLDIKKSPSPVKRKDSNSGRQTNASSSPSVCRFVFYLVADIILIAGLTTSLMLMIFVSDVGVVCLSPLSAPRPMSYYILPLDYQQLVDHTCAYVTIACFLVILLLLFLLSATILDLACFISERKRYKSQQLNDKNSAWSEEYNITDWVTENDDYDESASSSDDGEATSSAASPPEVLEEGRMRKKSSATGSKVPAAATYKPFQSDPIMAVGEVRMQQALAGKSLSKQDRRVSFRGDSNEQVWR